MAPSGAAQGGASPVTAWWRMAAATAGLTILVACSAPDASDSPSVAPSATVTAAANSLPNVFNTTSPKPSPKEHAAPVRIPPSRPTRLDISGAHPIHAQVLPYNRPGVLTPPNGNYHDVFVWTLRGLPGDGAIDTTYLFGHTYSGPTPGVMDHLQTIAFDVRGNVIKGTEIRVTTKTGHLTYCVQDALTVWQDELPSQASVWAINPPRQRGQWLVVIACFLSDDGSAQTGKNLVVLAKRC